MIKPQLNEFPEYYRNYVKEILDKNILEYLSEQKSIVIDLLKEIGEEKSLFRYEKNKWSIKEVIGHLIDTERIFATRGLHFARNEKQPLIGYEQDDYVTAANFDSIPIELLISDLNVVRESTISLYKTFDEDILLHKGIANGVEFTVAALGYIIAGHLDHHIKVIKERYI